MSDHQTHYDPAVRAIIAAEVANVLQAADADHAEQIAAAVEDTRGRIAQAIELDVDRMRRTGGGIYTADFTAGTQRAANIAREAGQS